MKIYYILLLIFILPNSNLIHEDTSLEIDKKGNIIGLPDEYSPAIFDLKKRKLRIKNKEIIIPTCFDLYFGNYKKNKIRLAASWYHSKNIMPFYLIFRTNTIHDKNYNTIINLETLELIEVQQTIIDSNSYQNKNIEIQKECKTEYINSIKSLN